MRNDARQPAADATAPHSPDCPICADTTKTVLFRGVDAATLSRCELLIAYRHAVYALEQERVFTRENAEMEALFGETARHLRRDS